MAEQDTDPDSMLPVIATMMADNPTNPSDASELHKKAILQRLRDNDAASNATRRSEESHTLSPSSDHTLSHKSGHVFEANTSSSSNNPLLEATASRQPQLKESCPPYPFRSGSCPREYHAQSKATWSPDGRCVLQLGEDGCLRTHMISPPPSCLIGIHEPPEFISAFAASPFFTCTNQESMLVFASVREEPIRLFNINSPDSKVQASYPLQSATDDVLQIPVDCIKFLPDNYHFIAAGQNCLATFDATRYNQKPVSQLYTHSKHRKKDRGDPFALSGRISTLDYREDGLLAVGTWSNKIGFYESFGMGEVLAIELMDNMRVFGHGYGIQTLRWSPDGNYLYISERTTDLITIFDVRMSNRKVSFLSGCNTRSKQRHGFDLLVDGNGHHVIAGDSDGFVRVWNNPTARSEEWNMGHDFEWQAHDDTIAAVAVNPVWPDFFVTTAGSRHFPTEEDYETSDSSDTDEDRVRHDDKKKPRREADPEELDAPVPEGWMKVWRW